MNKYTIRRKAEQARQTELKNKKLYVRLLQVEAVMKAYEEAYLNYHGTPAHLTYHQGWYTIHSRLLSMGARYREKDMRRMTQTLQARMHERELENA